MNKVCKYPKCDRPYHSNGYCSGHHTQWYRGKDLTPLRSRKKAGTQKNCAVKGCRKKHHSRGYCNEHYLLHWRGGKVVSQPMPQSRATGEWSNWYTNSAGYRERWRYKPGTKNGKERQREHRVVMEGMIGRPLLAHENVHHKNGSRSDNRPSNLELWSTSQPAGQRIEDKVEWAREILALYGDM